MAPTPPPKDATRKPRRQRSIDRVPALPQVEQVPPLPNRPRKEKEKKSFGLSWFGLSRDDDQKKRERRTRDESEPPKRRERDLISTILGKKKHDGDKRKGQKGGARGEAFDYARYPLHVERALYRLSHFKLANPRRALGDQVMISNLMFWYLSVVNQAQVRPTGIPGAPNGRTCSSQSEYDDAAKRLTPGTGPFSVHTGTLARVSLSPYADMGNGPAWVTPVDGMVPMFNGRDQSNLALHLSQGVVERQVPTASPPRIVPRTGT